MAQIFLFGRVTADLALKTSQTTGTTYVCFDLAENIGYGEQQRTTFYQVWAWGEDALRLTRLGIKKSSLIWLTGSLTLVDCTEKNTGTTKRLKVALDNCGFLPGQQPKHYTPDSTNDSRPTQVLPDFPFMDNLDGDRGHLPE